MSAMKHQDLVRELRGKDIKTLVGELRRLESQLVELKFSLAYRKLTNVRQLRSTRQAIARVQTIIREKLAQSLATDRARLKESQ